MADLCDFRHIVSAAVDWAVKDGTYDRFSARILKLQPNGREVLCVAAGFDTPDGKPVDWCVLFDSDVVSPRPNGVKKWVATVLTREKLAALVRAHDVAGKAPGRDAR